MTLEEAKKVADIIAQADGGCPYCVANLVEETQREFPEFKWTYDEEEMEVSVDQI